MGNAMIVPSLLLQHQNYSALTVLVLQMETLGATELQTLTNLHLPRLGEFQLHQYYFGVSYKIQPEHFAPVSRNFPALTKIVLNNVQATDDAIYELSKSQQLRCAHLRVVNTPSLDNYDMPLAPARIPYLQHSDYKQSLNVYTKFINNITTLTEVSFYGPTVKDTDLLSLVINNRNLSTVNLIYCKSLTTEGIAFAFNYTEPGISPSYPSNVHHITFTGMLIDAETIMSSFARLSSLKKLTMAGCTFPNCGDNIAPNLSNDPSRENVMEVYWLHSLVARFGILYECIPGKQSVMTRLVPSAPIVKHIADFL